MSKDLTQKNNAKTIYVKSFIIELLVIVLFVFLFSIVIYFFESSAKYASGFATISIAAGTFLASMYASKNIGNKGYLTGLIIGGITFIIVTIISLIIDKGGMTYNILFHLIIILLSSIMGGILGVNRKNNKKYI